MSSEQEILGLEDRRYAAMTSGDFTTLESLVHEDLVYGHSSGKMDTRASWLESMRSGATLYRSARCAGQKVRLYGDTALVTGRVDFEVEVAGHARTLRLNVLAVWIRTPQGWKFAGWQSTSVPALA
jgi:ketosteroid isomerase-like protein